MVTLRQICYIQKQYIQYGDSKLKDFCRLIFWYALGAVNPRFFTKKIDKLIKKYSVKDGKYEAAIGKTSTKTLVSCGFLVTWFLITVSLSTTTIKF